MNCQQLLVLNLVIRLLWNKDPIFVSIQKCRFEPAIFLTSQFLIFFREKDLIAGFKPRISRWRGSCANHLTSTSAHNFHLMGVTYCLILARAVLWPLPLRQLSFFASALRYESIEAGSCHSLLTWLMAKLSPISWPPFQTCSGPNSMKKFQCKILLYAGMDQSEKLKLVTWQIPD